MDIKGRVFVRHEKCKATMTLIDISRDGSGIVWNEYVCPECKTKKRLKRFV